MSRITAGVRRILVSEDGPTAVEYAVVLPFIVIVCIAAVQAIGSNASAKFLESADALT